MPLGMKHWGGASRFLLGLTAVVVLAACGPPYRIVRYATPNPLRGAARIVVDHASYEGLSVGNEPLPVYFSHRSPEQQASFQADQAAMAERFFEHLAERNPGRIIPAPAADAATLHLRINVFFMEPGVYAYIFSRATEVRASVRIVAPDGQILDEIALHATVQAGGFNPSSGQRFRQAGNVLADHVTAYIEDRTVLRARLERRSATPPM